ncbi:unnamed protein product, partial [Mesorhabditis belari]|uniref:Uncharacterized protein n=1 Tax=Mesorhabditis belari TaxID=2138241 RepID=A0AAF3F487_9BILA
MAEQKCLILRQGFCVLCLVLTLLFGIIAAIIAPLIASSFIEVEAIQERPGTNEHDLSSIRMQYYPLVNGLEEQGKEQEQKPIVRNEYRWNDRALQAQVVREKFEQKAQQQLVEQPREAFQAQRAAAFATSLALHDAKLRQQQKELELYAQLYNPGLLNGELGPIGPTGLTMHGGPAVHVGAPPIIHNIQWHQGSPEKEWLNAQEASNPAMPPVGWSERQSAIANGKVITQNSIVRWRGNPVPVGVGGTL